LSVNNGCNDGTHAVIASARVNAAVVRHLHIVASKVWAFAGPP
jgi:hypothetical protein